MLKDFLCKLGFSLQKTEDYLKELAASHPRGDIHLQWFFSRIHELGTPGEDPFGKVLLDGSAAPYLHSVLNAFGVPEKQIDTFFEGCREAGGDFNLRALIQGLKQVNTEMTADLPCLEAGPLLEQVYGDLRHMGISGLKPVGSASLSLRGVIAAFERLEAKGRQACRRADGGGGGTQSESSGKDMDVLIHRITENTAAGRNKGSISFAVDSEPKWNADALTARDVSRASQGDGKAGEAPSADVRPSPPAGHEETRFLGIVTPGKGYGEAAGKDPQTRTCPEASREGGSVALSGSSEGAPFKTGLHGGPAEKGPDQALPAHLMERAVKQILRSTLRGDKTFTLRLKPPELGVVRVALEIKENVLKLGVTTETPVARELLLSQVQGLKESLLEQGFKLEHVEVDVGQNFEQSLAHSKEGFKEGHGRQGGPREGSAQGEKMPEQGASTSDRSPGRNGLVDIHI